MTKVSNQSMLCFLSHDLNAHQVITSRKQTTGSVWSKCSWFHWTFPNLGWSLGSSLWARDKVRKHAVETSLLIWVQRKSTSLHLQRRKWPRYLWVMQKEFCLMAVFKWTAPSMKNYAKWMKQVQKCIKVKKEKKNDRNPNGFTDRCLWLCLWTRSSSSLLTWVDYRLFPNKKKKFAGNYYINDDDVVSTFFSFLTNRMNCLHGTIRCQFNRKETKQLLLRRVEISECKISEH